MPRISAATRIELDSGEESAAAAPVRDVPARKRGALVTGPLCIGVDPGTRDLYALDPGTTQTGWVHAVASPTGRRVLGSGVEDNAEMLRRVIFWQSAIGAELAIEMIASYGMPVGREVFETCVWIGRFVQAWQPREARLIYRRDVKLHLCGSARAKDPNVWQALVDKFGGDSVAVGRKATPGPLYGVKSHARAALGVAITALEAA